MLYHPSFKDLKPPAFITKEEPVKFDSDKVRVDLVDPLFILSTAKGLTYGAKKYSDHNWHGGILQSRLYAALMRHLLAYWSREDIDEESGNHHLDHAACMLMMLIRHAKDDRFWAQDDRPWKKGRKIPEDGLCECVTSCLGCSDGTCPYNMTKL